MADINHVTLVGRLVRDAELKYIASGQPVSKFSLAVNKRRKNGDQWVDEANYFDVVLWGRLGESINQYMTKGKQIAVEGELRQDRWEQDGQTRSKIEIVASNVMLLGGVGGGNGGSGSAPSNGGPATYQRKSESSYAPSGSTSYGGNPVEMDSGFTDDIPF